ncbi:hypothetical protein HMPREF1443_00722 [Helicobacter pylori HP250BFi]|nr:hypothetical protein HMPREF1443_00722 [Helicobacter pylori HP250BFi]
MRHATNPLNIKCWSVSFFFFLFVKGGWLKSSIIECFRIKG